MNLRGMMEATITRERSKTRKRFDETRVRGLATPIRKDLGRRPIPIASEVETTEEC